MDLRETDEQRAVLDEDAAWLADFLPADYDERYADYRWDLALRRAHQVVGLGQVAHGGVHSVPAQPRASPVAPDQFPCMFP